MFKLLESKAQLIQITDQRKLTKKVTRAICRPDEITLKKYQKVGIELSINDNAKSHEIYTLPQFLSMSENYCGIY